MLNHPLFRTLLSPRTVFLLTLLAALGALGAALVAQFGFGLKPCVMCLWQRVPYLCVVLVSAAALLLAKDNAAVIRAGFIALALCFLASAGLAFFHVGIEQKWWSLGGGCPVMTLEGKDTAAAVAALLTTPQADCSEVAWRVLGLSITVWNLALSLVLFDFTTLALFFNATRPSSKAQ